VIEFKKSPVPYGEEIPKGHWVMHEDLKLVVICCPGCGLLGTLRTHKVNDAGFVFPSIVCTSPGCTFHDFGKLLEWTP